MSDIRRISSGGLFEAKVGYCRAVVAGGWVIFDGEVEASKVSPEWHGWLHRTWDEPPTERPVPHKSWEKPHQENLTGTSMAYAPAGSLRRSDPAPRSDYEAWTPE